jgi:hypothetical protein
MTPSSLPRGQTSDLSSEVVLPAAALSLVRKALQKEASPLAATHVLNDAGFGSGPQVFEGFEKELGEDPAGLGEGDFWHDLSTFFKRRGWGRIETQRVHSGLGLLKAWNWAESDPSGADDQPGCHFSSGMLAYLLGRTAGAPIAVLEVSCRSRGDSHCGFLYGSEAAVHEIYGLLLDGHSLPEALAQL